MEAAVARTRGNPHRRQTGINNSSIFEYPLEYDVTIIYFLCEPFQKVNFGFLSSPTDSLQWPLQDFVVVSDEKKVSCEFFITTSVGTDTLYLSTEIATVVGNERK